MTQKASTHRKGLLLSDSELVAPGSGPVERSVELLLFLCTCLAIGGSAIGAFIHVRTSLSVGGVVQIPDQVITRSKLAGVIDAVGKRPGEIIDSGTVLFSIRRSESGSNSSATPHPTSMQAQIWDGPPVMILPYGFHLRTDEVIHADDIVAIGVPIRGVQVKCTVSLRVAQLNPIGSLREVAILSNGSSPSIRVSGMIVAQQPLRKYQTVGRSGTDPDRDSLALSVSLTGFSEAAAKAILLASTSTNVELHGSPRRATVAILARLFSR